MKVSFVNNGNIDIRCITTIGVSIKDTENPIGLFGTGLKYAIAIILRLGGEITIHSGSELFTFTTTQVEIRGKPVQVVCLNDQELGFTTHLGHTWKCWQALREIYCNMMDEGGTSHLGEIQPAPDTTVITVDLPEFTDCFNKIDEYILGTKEVFRGKTASFHTNQSNNIYYKSISVLEGFSKNPFFFATNFLCQIDLTEDRTAKDHWQIKNLFSKAILCCENESFLEKWLTVGPDFAEYEIDLDWPNEPSPEFLSVVSKLAMDTSRQINLSALNVLSKHAVIPDPIEAELLDVEKAALQKAIVFCKSLSYSVDDFPIIIVESLGENILGKADTNKRRIYIARRAILLGDLTLSSTLIEEWAHIKHGFKDCERNMQNWLFEQITRLGAAFLYNKR